MCLPHPHWFPDNFGADAKDTDMKKAACDNNGVYQKIEDNGNLKVAMASYFAYLAVGIVPKNGQDQKIRWAEMYEDGQGIGQNTAACAPAFDKTVSPPDLFGVVCSAVTKGELERLTSWSTEWAKMQAANAECPNLSLSEDELQAIRRNIGSESVCGAAAMGVSMVGLLFALLIAIGTATGAGEF